ncbi:MAG: YihY/virulence factor BrkB family protein [Frankia sp.]
MGWVAGVDRFQQRHSWAGFPLAVVYKFADDQGGFLVALITYFGFLSLFPLLLLLVTVLGFALEGNPELRQHVLDSALGQFPIIGTQLANNVHSLRGSVPAIVVGVVGLLYGVLGIGQAAQYALNRAWAVPRNERPNPLLARARSALLVLVFAAGVLATTVLSGVGSAADSYGARVGVGLRVGLLVASVVVDLALFVVAFRLLTARDVTLRDLLPGAVLAAIAWQGLQSGGALYVGHTLKRTTDIYGLFGLVLGLLAWIYLEATVVVLSSEINVVRACRLWPRSLLTPFSDDVSLTSADKRAYTSYAQMRRHKRDEEINVSFEGPPGKKRPDRS